ncbi:hypothetical protein GTU99_31055 [Streptomyces sp. PRKS01-65]|nr:hypothetical protein [Streptomyces harenosi]NEY36534.1 hypothetical protein [Streptomyces harenosi]
MENDNTLVILLSEEGADAERVAERTAHLREELLATDVEEVSAAPGEDAPPGARAVDVAQIGSLLVGLGSSAAALSQVVTVIRSWLGRCQDKRPSLRLTLGDDTLELSEATDEQVTEAFDMFVRRHSAAGAPP